MVNFQRIVEDEARPGPFSDDSVRSETVTYMHALGRLYTHRFTGDPIDPWIRFFNPKDARVGDEIEVAPDA